MNYATNIALVNKETNLVDNVIWAMAYQADEFNTDISTAVILADRPVSIGDSYDGEFFYHNGEIVYNMEERLTIAEQALSIVIGA